MNVADLVAEERDSAGQFVSHLYARKAPEYAVYQTAERAMVHFADDPGVADEQRKALAQLAPLRGETNGLIDGWRDMPDRYRSFGIIPRSNGAAIRKKAARFDRRIGDALIVALEGDLTGAGAVLQEIKDDVIDERVGWSRFEYLLIAIVIAVLFITLGSVIGTRSDPLNICDSARSARCFAEAVDLWRGAMAGAVGSFFSIALAIRGRTVLPDLNWINNWMDAGLRVAIGSIAGTVLVALVVSKFVNLNLGAATVAGSDGGGASTALFLAIVGFVGGFAERLVPDLLARAALREGEKPVLRKAEGDLDAKPAPAAGTTSDSTTEDQPGAADEADLHIDSEHEDGCVEDIDIEEEELTPDEGLPPATGGVAKLEEETVQ